MPPIRTLLWIGPSDELARLGVLDAPTLDVVWIDHVNALSTLPPLALDAIVLGRADGGLDPALSHLAHVRHASIDAPTIVLRSRSTPSERAKLEVAGAASVLDVAPQSDLTDARADSNETSETRPAAGATPARLIEALESLLAATPAARAPVGRTRRPAHGGAPPLVGSSRRMVGVEAAIRSAAGSTAPVLVLGETGSGKEIVARRVHAQSPRHGAAFVAVNCAAFADTLLESELFGHRRGAYTGADRDRVGLFERAEGGTVFLDEIGETSAALQARLLRVLQEREVLPVGADRPRRVDVRIIAATHRNLGAEIEANRFREDLFYRLAVLQVELPALRERRADIAQLAEHFLAKHGEREGKPGCQLSPRALHLLERHAWPGNVRELENEIQRALALAEPGELITARRLSPLLRRDPDATPAPGARATDSASHIDQAETLQQALARIEAGLIREALTEHEGRRAVTARRLGITREGLHKKMKRLGVR